MYDALESNDGCAKAWNVVDEGGRHHVRNMRNTQQQFSNNENIENMCDAPESDHGCAKAWNFVDEGGEQHARNAGDTQVRDLGDHARGLPSHWQIDRD